MKAKGDKKKVALSKNCLASKKRPATTGRTSDCKGCDKLNRDKIKLLDMVQTLKRELNKHYKKIPNCQICEMPMRKYSTPNVDGEDDWVEITELWYCQDCTEVEGMGEPHQSMQGVH